MFGPGGQCLLDEMELADAYVVRVESLRDLIEIYDREVVMLERWIHQLLRDDRGYQINGILHGNLTVDQQEHQLRNGELVVGPPKSDAGRRPIALPPFLVPELEAHLGTLRGPGTRRPRVPGREGWAAAPARRAEALGPSARGRRRAQRLPVPRRTAHREHAHRCHRREHPRPH